jgi:tRNA(Ile)-lysidine synthase
MPAYRVDGDITWWRPLLETSPQEIVLYAQKKQIPYIEDPSNLDLGYARNRIRHQVLPALQQAVPGALKGIARAVRHAQGAAELERQAGEHVLGLIMDRQQSLCLHRLKELPELLRNATLRAWCLKSGVAVPSELQLHEWWRQLSQSRSDAQISISWDRRKGGSFRCYRDRIYFVSKSQPFSPTHSGEVSMTWSGQAHWRPEGWDGYFSFQQHEGPGIPDSLLQRSILQARPRSGGEKFRAWPHQHHRSLKHWYQWAGVPAWERDQAPILYLEGQLLFVPGVGLAAEFCTSGPQRWALEWVAAQNRYN